MIVVAHVVAVVLAGVLLSSGTAKLVAPAALSTAIAELLGSSGSFRGAVRAVAALELAASVLLVLRPEHPATRIVVAGLGLAFAAAGVAGRRRRTTRPCGCFGSTSAGSFGLWNAAMGLVFVLWAAWPWASPYDPMPAVVAALAVALTIPIWGNRDAVRMLVNQRVKQRAAQESTR